MGVAAVLLCHTSFAANYALVVGVNECLNYTPRGVRPLRLAGAEADANAFADLLQLQFGFSKRNVHVLTAGNATYEAIADEFEYFMNELIAEDQFIFYFAGHGTQVPDGRPYPPRWNDEVDDLDEALCPHNAATAANDRAVNLIVDDQLATWLDSINAIRITVVLDCCHAGTGTKGTEEEDIRERSAIPTHDHSLRSRRQKQPWQDLLVARKGPGKNIAALYASGPNQPAVERMFRDLPAPVQMRGQFSKLLVDYLNSDGADASLSKISTHLQREIDAWATQKNAGPSTGSKLSLALQRASQQRPSFEPTDRGDRPLIYREAR
jgi:hypothetical protein